MKRKYGVVTSMIKEMEVGAVIKIHITEHTTTRSTLDRFKRDVEYRKRRYTLLKSGRLTYELTRIK